MSKKNTFYFALKDEQTKEEKSTGLNRDSLSKFCLTVLCPNERKNLDDLTDTVRNIKLTINASVKHGIAGLDRGSAPNPSHSIHITTIAFIGVSITVWRAIAAGRVESDRFIEDFTHVIEQVWEYKTI